MITRITVKLKKIKSHKNLTAKMQFILKKNGFCPGKKNFSNVWVFFYPDDCSSTFFGSPKHTYLSPNKKQTETKESIVAHDLCWDFNFFKSGWQKKRNRERRK